MPNESVTEKTDGEEQTSNAGRVRLGSSSAYQFVAQVVGLGTSFVASVLIARALGPDGKGQLSILQQVPGTLLVLMNLGLAGANTYFVGTRKIKPGTALGNSLAFAGVVGLVGLPLVWLFTTGPAAIVEGLTTWQAAIAFITLPFGIAGSCIAAISIGLGHVKQTSVAQFVGSAISVAFILTAYALGYLNLSTAIGASAISLLITIALNSRSVLGDVKHLEVSWQALRMSSKYSLKSYLSNLAGYLNYRQDILLVGYLAGAKAVGIYSIAVTFAELMWYAPNSIATALLSKSLTSERDEAYRLASQTARLVSALMIGIVIAAAALIVPVIRVFYGSAFVPAAQSFMILLPGAWLMGNAKIFGAYLGSRGYQYPKISVIGAVMNFVLNLALIPWLGFNGAAIASAISYIYLGLRSAGYFREDTGATWAEMFWPTREDWTMIGASASGYARRLLKR